MHGEIVQKRLYLVKARGGRAAIFLAQNGLGAGFGPLGGVPSGR